MVQRPIFTCELHYCKDSGNRSWLIIALIKYAYDNIEKVTSGEVQTCTYFWIMPNDLIQQLVASIRAIDFILS